MLVMLTNKHAIYQVYLIEKKGSQYKIWIEGQSEPIYENVEDVELICK